MLAVCSSQDHPAFRMSRRRCLVSAAPCRAGRYLNAGRMERSVLRPEAVSCGQREPSCRGRRCSIRNARLSSKPLAPPLAEFRPAPSTVPVLLPPRVLEKSLSQSRKRTRDFSAPSVKPVRRTRLRASVSPAVTANLRERALRDAERLRARGKDHVRLTALEELAVGPSTTETYQILMSEFRRRTLCGKRFRATPAGQAQRLVMSHLSLMFHEEREASEGMKFLAAVGHFFPQLGKGSRSLPRARRMLQGWSKVCPASARVPPPNCAVCALAVEMARDRQVDMAVATLIAHQCYLRPDELHSLRRRDVIAPQGGRGGEGCWSLLLGPVDLRRPTKTGIFDDSVLVDHPMLLWLGRHIARLKTCGDQEEPIWPFTRAAYGRQFAKGVRRLQLGHWGFVPYSLRHSGPSWDRNDRRLSLLEIQRRGRWLDPRTVVRYERSSKISALLSTLSRTWVSYLRLCETHLRQYVEGDIPCPKLPGASGATFL